jgi:hypothetical protein
MKQKPPRYKLIPMREIVREAVQIERERVALEMKRLREDSTRLRRLLADALLELDRLKNPRSSE